MKGLMRCGIFACFLCLVANLAVHADAIDDVVTTQMKARRIPGMSVAVIHQGKVVKAKGYGYAELEWNIPATADSVYEIGSISKHFASEALMLLVEDPGSRISLDDPINRWLPPSSPAAWKAITIRDLLNHTSGLADWTEATDFSYRREYSADEFLALVRDRPLLYAPRDSWSYSNTNTVLLGLIIEKASGQPYEKFVSERIINPLGLPTIRFHDRKDVVPKKARGYVLRSGELNTGEPFRPRIIAPSGGVMASAVDLAKWWEAALSGRIVNRAGVAQMVSPVRLNDGRSVAHGFAVFTNTFNGHKFLFHNGSTVGGFGSGVYHFPDDKLTIAVVGNLEDGGFGAEYIIKRIAGIFAPGSFIGGLAERDSELTAPLLSVLHDIAANRPSGLLTTGYAARIQEPFRRRVEADLKNMKSFRFLATEKIGQEHFVLDPALTTMHYFRLTTSAGPVFYHFRMDKNGKVGFIIAEN